MGFDQPREEKEQQEVAYMEMNEGYLDGMKPDSPEPSSNRGRSYLHGFRCGRDDLNRKPHTTAAEIRQEAEAAIAADAAR